MMISQYKNKLRIPHPFCCRRYHWLYFLNTQLHSFYLLQGIREVASSGCVIWGGGGGRRVEPIHWQEKSVTFLRKILLTSWLDQCRKMENRTVITIYWPMILLAPCIIDFIGPNGLRGPVGGRGPWTLLGPEMARAKRVPFALWNLLYRARRISGQ